MIKFFVIKTESIEIYLLCGALYGAAVINQNLL